MSVATLNNIFIINNPNAPFWINLSRAAGSPQTLVGPFSSETGPDSAEEWMEHSAQIDSLDTDDVLDIWVSRGNELDPESPLEIEVVDYAEALDTNITPSPSHIARILERAFNDLIGDYGTFTIGSAGETTFSSSALTLFYKAKNAGHALTTCMVSWQPTQSKLWIMSTPYSDTPAGLWEIIEPLRSLVRDLHEITPLNY